jgi:hypothetical protein
MRIGSILGHAPSFGDGLRFPLADVGRSGYTQEDMVTRESSGPSLPRRGAGLLFAGLFVAFLVSQAPHLVHHFFEPQLVQDECPFAASGERTGGLEAQPVAVVMLAPGSTPALTATQPAAPSVVPAVSRGRAPPAPLS